MTNEWRAIERVGKDIELTDDTLRSFKTTVRSVYRESWEEEKDNYNLNDEFFDFVENEVLSDEKVVDFLATSGVNESTITQFKNAEIDLADKLESNFKFSYGLDQLVDFIMMVKLIKQFNEYTGENIITPRDRLHYLIYLVNDELANEEDYSAKPQSVGLGMLERTGYRYTFRKQPNGPYSERLNRDKDRLYAWNILDEEVDQNYRPDSYQPFGLSLGSSGRILYQRHQTQFEGLNTAGSDLLREWAYKQKDVIQRYANLDIKELREHVCSINEFNSKQDGSVLLAGRARIFDSSDGAVESISGGMKHA